MELLSFLYLTIDIICLISMIINFAMKRWHPGIISLVSLFFYPWVLEPLLWIYFKIIYKCYRRPYNMKLDKKTANVIYHPKYNIKLCGIEKKHPFDSCKYERILKFLKEDHNMNIVANGSDLNSRIWSMKIFLNLIFS